MHNVDVPTADDLLALAGERGDACVSVVLPTSPVSSQAQAGKVELKNAAAEAERTLRDRGVASARVEALAAALGAIVEDDEFWRYQSQCLAVFATPDAVHRYRLQTSAPATRVTVGDRFRLGPLLEAVAFPRSAYVLVLSEKAGRLIELVADSPVQTVHVHGLPPDPSVLEHTSTPDDRARDRAQGATGDRVERDKYARLAQDAVLPVVRPTGLPLILAAPQPLAPAYRSISSYEHFVEEGLDGNFDAVGDTEVAARALPVLDRLQAGSLAAWREEFGRLSSAGRATADLSDVARATAMGAVETLMISLDADLTGRVAEDDGTVDLDDTETPAAGSYPVLDELAARVLQASGTVLPVRGRALPERSSPVAAILRYAI